MATLDEKPASFDSKGFTIDKRVLRVDRLMNRIVTLGGTAIIITVLGIFVFIFIQILPLFRSAKLSALPPVETGITAFSFLGTDEWAELPFLCGLDGTFHFVDLTGQRGIFDQKPDWPEAPPVFTAVAYQQDNQEVLFGGEDGRIIAVQVAYETDFSQAGQRSIEVSLLPEEVFIQLGGQAGAILSLDAQTYDEQRMIAGIQETPGGHAVHVVILKRKQSLLDEGVFKITHRAELSELIEGTPEQILVNVSADALVVLTQEGKVHFLVWNRDGFSLRQVFAPFGDREDARVASMDFLLGRISLYLTHSDGTNLIYSQYRSLESGQIEFGHTKTFPQLRGGGTVFASSLRNKAFLIGSGKEVSLRFSTTQTVRWSALLANAPQAAVISGKYDCILLADAKGHLYPYGLDDPHPEANWQAFFGKIQYEGQEFAEYAWQSSGAADSFEPKLSLVPLIFGSIKGTLFALIFAVPIALLAAIYTAQFLRQEWRRVVKPVMEIMASLPSVVLGFLAALWLAPLIEDRIPSLLLLFVVTPIVVVGIVQIWGRLPQAVRCQMGTGREWLVLVPAVIATVWFSWEAGPFLEAWLFVVEDPETGQRVADFRQWWPRVLGLPFEQRNSLVVGFMMGFAVIPIIFTISEDSIAQVPRSLTSGSLALGASRWQTTARVVLPTALAGIFSAFMIGLGRAVGETMIVVMATGNTPIMDWNIFSGMRTLSANIAVELPEAPHHGTLYRTLFLGAMVLFILTFFVNSLAEILRHRLRKQYKQME